jgi:hypothetical protein
LQQHFIAAPPAARAAVEKVNATAAIKIFDFMFALLAMNCPHKADQQFELADS